MTHIDLPVRRKLPLIALQITLLKTGALKMLDVKMTDVK